MEIESVQIENYRSVRNLKLYFAPVNGKNCHILLGKNESGKSNILKAVGLHNSSLKSNHQTDCTKSTRKSENNTIQIRLKLSPDFDFLYENMYKIEMPEELVSDIHIEYCERVIEISGNNDRSDYLHVYIKEINGCNKYVYDKSENQIFTLKSVEQHYDQEINEDNISEVTGDGYTILTKLDVETCIEQILRVDFEVNMPKVIYWQPSNDYLIDKPIDLHKFLVEPSISKPLNNMFRIAGVKDIDEVIAEVLEDELEREQFEKTVSIEVTKYVNKVWPEQKVNISLRIESDGLCYVNVEDQHDNISKFSITQRSDGFKQFLSILLNLSIENTTKSIQNSLILLDEPEIHLHPSGVKFLLKELLNISQNNIILLSTHSPYMVDKVNLERHYKVEKLGSETIITQIKKDNPYEEEVIYESLGTSIFEYIMPIMLIFEGSTDKDIFDTFSKKFKREIGSIELGTMAGRSAEHLPKYAKFFTGKIVNGFIVADSDEAGLNAIKDIKRDNDYYNDENCFTINDIYETNKESSLEDLFPYKVINDIALKKFGLHTNFDSDTTVKQQINNWNKTQASKINEKQLKSEITQYIISDVSRLPPGKCKTKYPVYHTFLMNVYKRIKG